MRDYEQTLKCLMYHIDGKHFRSILEIGCGVGTWSVYLRNYSESMTVIDISRRMVEITLSRLRRLNFNEISGIVSDFQTPCLKIDSKYDAIFCIRAIEYMENKVSALSYMNSLLNPGGFIFIITKNPHRNGIFRFILSLAAGEKIVKPPKPSVHEIHFRNLLTLTQKLGFTNMNVYPAVVSYSKPFLKAKQEVLLSNATFESIYKKRLNPLYIPLAIIESYCVVARNPK